MVDLARRRLLTVRAARALRLGTLAARRTGGAVWLRARTRRMDQARRAELEDRYHTRTAEDVTALHPGGGAAVKERYPVAGVRGVALRRRALDLPGNRRSGAGAVCQGC